MKKFFLVLSIALSSLQAHANEGSWFGTNAGYENLSSGFNDSGYSIGAEGGYWYLGNMAYGALFKANLFGTANGVAGTDLKIYDLGAFWKVGTDQGLYGRLLAGVAFVNLDGSSPNFKLGDGKSFYFGLGGGLQLPLSESFGLGPDISYRHLTAGSGGDQLSLSVLGSFTF